MTLDGQYPSPGQTPVRGFATTVPTAENGSPWLSPPHQIWVHSLSLGSSNCVFETTTLLELKSQAEAPNYPIFQAKAPVFLGLLRQFPRTAEGLPLVRCTMERFQSTKRSIRCHPALKVRNGPHSWGQTEYSRHNF